MYETSVCNSCCSVYATEMNEATNHVTCWQQDLCYFLLFSLLFSPICHLMEFWFLATVALAFGLLSWGHLIFNNITDLPYLRWTLTQFSSRNKLLVFFHVITVKLLWYNLYCYIKKGDLTFLSNVGPFVLLFFRKNKIK